MLRVATEKQGCSSVFELCQHVGESGACYSSTLPSIPAHGRQIPGRSIHSDE